MVVSLVWLLLLDSTWFLLSNIVQNGRPASNLFDFVGHPSESIYEYKWWQTSSPTVITQKPQVWAYIWSLTPPISFVSNAVIDFHPLLLVSATMGVMVHVYLWNWGGLKHHFVHIEAGTHISHILSTVFLPFIFLWPEVKGSPTPHIHKCQGIFLMYSSRDR